MSDDLLLANLRTIGTHHCDNSVGMEAAEEIERLRANLAALEDEKNTYIDYVGDALGQDHDGETLWDAAQRVLSERDRYRVIVERLLESADSNPFGTVGHFCEHGPASVEISGLRTALAARGE